MSEQDLRESHPGPAPDSPIERLATHQAAANNNVTELADLVQGGAQLLGTDTKETPLHAAAKKGALDSLRWLLDNKTVSPLEKAGNGNTAAHYAAVYGHLESLKLLVEHDGELGEQVVSQVDESGLSLISLSTLQGDKEMTKWLIDNFPQVADIPNANGDLPVHFAAAQGHLDILKMFVRQYGKEILEKQDKNATKPVYFASQEGQLMILDYLINELGVDPVAREKSGVSTVHAAVQAGQYKAVKWLISKLGSKYILDKTIDGATPLHMAAAQGHTDILRYLLDNLENKDDVNVLDHIHATPAHDAAEYGQMQSMLLLLRNGADISIKDTEGKTPYELAVEQNHPDVAAMIADLRDNGPTALSKYDKKKRHNSQPPLKPRTVRQEAEELSVAIKQTADLQEHRKTQQLRRQESLQGMNEKGVEDDGKKLDDDEIEHIIGPKGDLYARPKKRKLHQKNGSRQGSDVDLLDDSRPSKQNQSLLDAVLPLDDSTYAAVQQETGSNYSRPSRVRHYQDSDSEITSISSRYRDGRHNIPGFYPPYGGYYPPHPPPPPPRKGHHSSASSLHSSKAGRSRRQHGGGYPMMPYGPYGYYPIPYPPYGYPYPHYGPGFHPKTTEDRMHLEALQQGQASHMMAPMYYYQQPRGRRSRLKKRTRSRQASRDPSPRGASRRHTDADMGYGPPVKNMNESGAKGKEGGVTSDQSGFHPQAPPITRTDGTVQGGEEVVKFDSNFIMMKKSDTAEQVKQLGGTTLNLAKAPQHYDGRWDSYIMTDSEPEHDVDENYCVAFAAETAAILVIGCVSGLRGLKKIRKGTHDVQPDKAYLSSAWDEPPMPSKSHSRRGSISGVADPTLKDVSPEDFAAREEMKEQTGWAGKEKKAKGKKHKKGNKHDSSTMQRSASAEALDKQPQSELLADELEKQSYASVSRSFGQKMLFDALGARESSMLDIASTSLAGSMMSLEQHHNSGDEEQDNFDETINMVHGTKTEKRSKKKGDIDAQPDKGQATEGDDARPLSAKQKDKQKAKEAKARKEKEKEDKKREKKNAKKEKQIKKDEEKKASRETKEKVKEASKPTTVTSPKKSSPPVPVRSAPPPPKPAAAKEIQRPKQQPSHPSQERLQSPESASYHKHVEQRPITTSTPKDGGSLKKNRKEKAQLKSSPSQPIRTAPTKQTSRHLDKEAKTTSASKLKSPPKEEPKAPTQRKNPYFENESDEEDSTIETKTAGWMSGQSQTQNSKPPIKEEPVDLGIAELDDVLAQLEDIQSGSLMAWAGLESNKVTNADDSEESEDSLPLNVPNMTAPIKKQQQKQATTSPSGAGTFGGHQTSLGSGEHTEGNDGTGDSSPPPIPRFGDSGQRTSAGHDYDEEAGESTELQRTKHGSPHPRKRKDGQVSVRKTSPSADMKPTLALQSAQYDTDGTRDHRSTFEQNVMSTLEALKESMNQLKGNPSITQTEITEQTKLQQQLIQNLITYSQHDPQLVNRLISLITEKNQDVPGMESSSSHQLEQLQERILGAHEKTYQETQEHFRTQEALQRAIQRTLEEQSQQQMKGMQANFEMFSKLMEEQLTEQRKKFEEELKKREMEEQENREMKEKRKKKKGKGHSKKKDRKKRHKHYSDSDSDSSESEDEEMLISGKALSKPPVKTMEAKIFTQELLTEEPATPQMQGRGKARLVRRGTDMELTRTTEALHRNLDFEDMEEDDEDEMHFQHAKPVTIRRADIKFQRQDGDTAQRPTRDGPDDGHQGYMQVASMKQASMEESYFDDFHMLKKRPPKQLEVPEKKPDFDEKDLRYGKQHVEVNERQKPVEDVHPLAGAGSELAAALKVRQKQIKNKEHK